VATIGTIAFAEPFPLTLKSPRNTEQVLAVNVEGTGIVLITGCGHPTVERIIARAQAAFDEPIIGIVGGLHYEGLTREQVQPRIGVVQALNPQLVAVSPHDSSLDALRAFRAAFPVVYQDIKVGQPVILEDR
jgi:7,8-dihydropterin-6-yl-methyl-4-(beta-D-ribofuranosyl)aminobenzene 5'-phosphate synthase